MTAVAEHRGSGRGPGSLYTALSLFALVAVVLFTLTTPRETPPAIAEIAPAAIEQIKEAPKEQTSSFGRDAGGPGEEGQLGEGGPAATTPSTTVPPRADQKAPLERSSVRRCVGDPPRQIEDPQAPPCVPLWTGDNGGATTKGVNADEITVAVADGGGSSQHIDPAVVTYFEAFFNKRFELYGRKLNLVFYSPNSTTIGGTVDTMQADAVKVDQEIRAFAAVNYSEQDGRDYVYYDELAHRKVVGVMLNFGGLPRVTEEHLRRNAPYQWNYLPVLDTYERNYGEFVCKVLKDGRPRYAGVPQSTLAKRKLAIIVDTRSTDTPPQDVSILKSTLDACGAPYVTTEWNGGGHESMLLNLRQQDVTSVICTCHSGNWSTSLMQAATETGFHPEWLATNFGHQDDDLGIYYAPSDQVDHIIGLQALSKFLPLSQMPHCWALQETAPSYGCYYDYIWLYKALLLLTSGIQAAGPRLTPDTFQAGLFRTTFPNPGAGGPPYYQARVGFPGVHTMQQDLAIVWASSSIPSLWATKPPTYCYVGLGKRYSLGTWPSGDPGLATGPCR